MKTNNIFITMLLLASTVLTATASTNGSKGFFDQKTFTYELNAGVNIGGSAPLPIPGQIRSIESYGPGLNLSIGATIIKWIDKKWGVAISPRFENKGMLTNATASNYGMTIIQNGIETTGFWTGKVRTKYHQSVFTLPILGEYKLNDKWRLSFGPWLGVSLSNDFSGHVSDGYLCPYSPGSDTLGGRIYFSEKDHAPYDFSDEVRTLQYGLELGGSWQAFRHFSLEARLEWGLNNIFKSSFHTISFPLYPIYLNIGFGYTF